MESIRGRSRPFLGCSVGEIGDEKDDLWRAVLVERTRASQGQDEDGNPRASAPVVREDCDGKGPSVCSAA